MPRPRESKRVPINVIVDTREKTQKIDWSLIEDNYYDFIPHEEKLDAGDYSILGLENQFTIEWKATTAEISQNILEPRFEEEFKRLAEYKHKIVLCAFDARDILNFPLNSGIPKHLWGKLKITGKFILKKIVDLELTYGVNFKFAGEHAEDIAVAIMKRVNKELNG